jgi:hypothetical protein
MRSISLSMLTALATLVVAPDLMSHNVSHRSSACRAWASTKGPTESAATRIGTSAEKHRRPPWLSEWPIWSFPIPIRLLAEAALCSGSGNGPEGV